jgi:hypothetical protein
LGRGGGDKVSKFVSPENQVFLIEHALGETSKEPGHAIFEDFSSRTE